MLYCTTKNVHYNDNQFLFLLTTNFCSFYNDIQFLFFLQRHPISVLSSLLQILEFLSRRKQKEKKSRNRNFKATPAWIISSGQMKSGPGTLPDFKCWRAAVNSLCEKLSEIFTGSSVVALQRSDTS